MSIFVCEECGCIENTALSSFWMRNGNGRTGQALCSACDPTIGRWHGMFPRRQYDPTIDRPQFMDGEWVRATKSDHTREEH